MRDIPRITVDELKERLAGGEPPLIMDVRGKTDYVQEHIAGAIWLPASQLPARHTELPHSRSIVTY